MVEHKPGIQKPKIPFLAPHCPLRPDQWESGSPPTCLWVTGYGEHGQTASCLLLLCDPVKQHHPWQSHRASQWGRLKGKTGALHLALRPLWVGRGGHTPHLKPDGKLMVEPSIQSTQLVQAAYSLLVGVLLPLLPRLAPSGFVRICS